MSFQTDHRENRRIWPNSCSSWNWPPSLLIRMSVSIHQSKLCTFPCSTFREVCKSYSNTGHGCKWLWLLLTLIIVRFYDYEPRKFVLLCCGFDSWNGLTDFFSFYSNILKLRDSYEDSTRYLFFSKPLAKRLSSRWKSFCHVPTAKVSKVFYNCFCQQLNFLKFFCFKNWFVYFFFASFQVGPLATFSSKWNFETSCFSF